MKNKRNIEEKKPKMVSRFFKSSNQLQTLTRPLPSRKPTEITRENTQTNQLRAQPIVVAEPDTDSEVEIIEVKQATKEITAVERVLAEIKKNFEEANDPNKKLSILAACIFWRNVLYQYQQLQNANAQEEASTAQTIKM